MCFARLFWQPSWFWRSSLHHRRPSSTAPPQAADQSFCSDDPRYPAPQDDNLVFYLQLSDKTDTVVYAANRRTDGTIDTSDPVLVYWRLYDKSGEKGELTFLQRSLAFGVQLAPSKDYPGDYVARLNAYPNIPVLIDETKDGAVRAVMRIANEPAQLICVYVERRIQFGFVPQVLYIDFFGRTLDGGKKVVGRLKPKRLLSNLLLAGIVRVALERPCSRSTSSAGRIARCLKVSPDREPGPSARTSGG